MLFKEVVGHSDLKKKLVEDVREKKVSHAHLFLGNLGFGGLPLALAFTQYLLCENKQENDSCGECSACKKVDKLEHPDLHFTFPTAQALTKTSNSMFTDWKKCVLENPYFGLSDWIEASDPKGRKPIISVHQSMEIIKSLSLKSFDGGYKVSIIWMAEEMNQSCANKLLKIIEEPPKNTIFILIAELEDMILPTILSRTQILKIKPLEEEAIGRYLKEKSNIDEELIKSITSRSQGDLAMAIELLNSGESENNNCTLFIELMRVSFQKNVLSMMNWAEQMSKLGRAQQKYFIKYALYMVRQSLIQNYTEGQLSKTSPEEAQFLSKFAKFITGNNVMQFNKLFNDAHYNIERNAYGRLTFTNITFEVMRYIHRA